MKKILLFMPVCILFLHTVKAQTTITDSILSGGIERHYLLYLSKNYTPGNAMPLVILLHAYTMTAQVMEPFSDFTAVADTGNFLAVYPEGLIDKSGYPYWYVGWTWQPVANDVGFISDLIDSLHSRNDIDLNRVYAAGVSNGGFMCYSLASQLSNKIVAVASVSGSVDPAVFDTMTAKRAVPLIQIHGTLDGTVPYNGNSTGSFPCVNIDTLLKFWYDKDQCTGLDSIAIPNISATDGSTVEEYLHTGGISNSSVVLYKIKGGGHANWPGSSYVSGNNEDFNASSAMWNFFKQYTLDEFPLSVKPVTNHQSLFFYPDPATSTVSCTLSPEWKSATIHLRVMNAIGQVVKNYDLQPGSILQMDIRDLPAGYYMAQLNNGKTNATGKLIKE